MVAENITKEFILNCAQEANEGLYYYLSEIKKFPEKSISFLNANKPEKVSLKHIEHSLKGRSFDILKPVNRLFVQSPEQVFDMDIEMLAPEFKPFHGFEAILQGLEKQNRLEAVLQLKAGDPKNNIKFRRIIATQLKEKNLIPDEKKYEKIKSLLFSKEPVWLTWRWLHLLSLAFDIHFQIFSLGKQQDFYGVFVPHSAPDASSVYLSENIAAYVRLGHVGAFVGKQVRQLFTGIHIPKFNEG